MTLPAYRQIVADGRWLANNINVTVFKTLTGENVVTNLSGDEESY